MATASSKKLILNVPVNRVEGDLELRVAIEDGVVTDAWSVGTSFRGFESILVGRAAMDSLVISPRICGMCSVSHLLAAVKALDAVSGAEVPDNARRLRNVTVMAEHVQNDMRQGFLMLAPGLASPTYRQLDSHDEAVRRYQPLRGETALQVIQETRKVVEIIAILGGQWPHSAFMVPGGVVSHPQPSDVTQCLALLDRFRLWYEDRILGCSIERWKAVTSAADLDAWLAENDRHRDSDLGFFWSFSRQAGLDRMGGGRQAFLSFGSLDMPRETEVAAAGNGDTLVPDGFVSTGDVRSFDQSLVTEDVSHAWYRGSEGGRHPFAGETRPYASGAEAGKYSWAKAPRYDGVPAETGPLAERMVARDPLFSDLVKTGHASAAVRALARMVRPAMLIPAMQTWLREMVGAGSFYSRPANGSDGEGYGTVEAARGALGHWVKVADGRIVHYQIITPTAWNASPRDTDGARGPWEEALLGTPVKDPDNPVELGHVVRSFDPCMVCCVHTLRPGRSAEKFVI